jgi:hypothetical protein
VSFCDHGQLHLSKFEAVPFGVTLLVALQHDAVSVQETHSGAMHHPGPGEAVLSGLPGLAPKHFKNKPPLLNLYFSA